MATVKFATYLAAARQQTRLKEWQEETKKKDSAEFFSRPFEAQISAKISEELAQVYYEQLKLDTQK